MEGPTTQGENNSRSASEKGISDTDQKKPGSGSTTSSKSKQNQEESTTPTANPPQGGQQQFTMAPPPRPNFKATPTSAQPSKPMSQASSQEASQDLPTTSSQTIGNGDQPAAPFKQPANDKTHATPRKRSHVEVDQEPTAHDQESSDEDAEPADQIASFDWRELEQRYHDQMDRYSTEEQDLYRSFNELCGYFYVWAETGHAHEVERSFKRMKTQIALVQHNEEVLEGKRQHYVKVVEAFKTVARMLNDDEKAAPARSTLSKYADRAETLLSRAKIVEAYDWDDVHPSRCVIL